MADPLSISASIISVLRLGKSLVDYITQVKTATEDCRLILTEVTSTSFILSLVNDKVLQNQDESWSATVASLAMPEGPIKHFEGALKRLASKLMPASGTKKAIKALKWPFEKGEVREILESIERLKSLFNLALQNDHM